MTPRRVIEPNRPVRRDRLAVDPDAALTGLNASIAKYGAGPCSREPARGNDCPGMNVFVIKTAVRDVSFATIFKGVLPFIATDVARLVILIAFPSIALYLPSLM